MRFFTHVHRTVNLHLIIVATVQTVDLPVKIYLINVLDISVPNLTIDLLILDAGDSYSCRLTCYNCR